MWNTSANNLPHSALNGKYRAANYPEGTNMLLSEAEIFVSKNEMGKEEPDYDRCCHR